MVGSVQDLTDEFHQLYGRPLMLPLQNVAGYEPGDETGVLIREFKGRHDRFLSAGDASPNAIAPTFGHLREPILFVTNVLRGLAATPPRPAAGHQHAERGVDSERAINTININFLNS